MYMCRSNKCNIYSLVDEVALSDLILGNSNFIKNIMHRSLISEENSCWIRTGYQPKYLAMFIVCCWFPANNCSGIELVKKTVSAECFMSFFPIYKRSDKVIKNLQGLRRYDQSRPVAVHGIINSQQVTACVCILYRYDKEVGQFHLQPKACLWLGAPSVQFKPK